MEQTQTDKNTLSLKRRAEFHKIRGKHLLDTQGIESFSDLELKELATLKVIDLSAYQKELDRRQQSSMVEMRPLTQSRRHSTQLDFRDHDRKPSMTAQQKCTFRFASPLSDLVESRLSTTRREDRNQTAATTADRFFGKRHSVPST